MSSGAQPAIINFPASGIDVYSTKLDRGTSVVGESHTVPLSPAYEFYLAYAPQSGTVSIPAYTEVASGPIGLQYSVTYSGVNFGLVSMDASNAGVTITASYTTNGDVVRAFYFQDLQTSVVNIENFIASGLGISGNYLPLTGGIMVGDISVNGANILTSVASGNQIGDTASPFGSVHAVQFDGDLLSNEAGTEYVSLVGGTNISSATSATTAAPTINEIATSSINLSSAGSVNITSPNTNVLGNVKPSVTAIYDLGASGNRWATVYATNLDVPGFSGNFVNKAGDSMTGALNMTSGSAITVDTIENNSGNLLIDSSAGLSLNANNITVTSDNGVTITPAALNSVNLANTLYASSAEINVSTVVLPTASGIDVGSSGMYFGTVYAANFIGGSLSGNFVSKDGDTMVGDLVMGDPNAIGDKPSVITENIESLQPSGVLNVTAGELAFTATNNVHFDLGPTGNQTLQLGLAGIYFSKDVVPTASGTYDLGSPSMYIDTVYANNLTAQNLTGGIVIQSGTFGDINVTGVVSFGSGSSITAVSGLVIGSSGSPVSTLYVDTIISNAATGTYLLKAGDTIAGNLETNASGTNDIGTAAAPFNAIYADSIVSAGLDALYVLKAGDTMTGPLVIESIQSTGSLTISGVTTLGLYFNQVNSTAEQHNITSTVGPIILDAQTEIQQLINGTAKSVINASGTEVYDNIYPDTSGSYSLGTINRPFNAIYANLIVPTNVSGTGNFVLKVGDSMTGALTMIGADVLTSVSGANNIGSAAVPFNTVYADNYYLGTGTIGGAFVHTTGDTMTGPLSVANLTDVNNIIAPANLNVITTSSTAMTAGANLTLTAITQATFTGAGGNIQMQSTSTDGVTLNSNGRIYLSPTLGSGVIVQGDVWPAYSGSYFVGTAAFPFSGVYARTINSTGVGPLSSGTGNLGTLAVPWSGLYVRNINGFAATTQIYNEIPSGLVNGVNDTFYTAYASYSNTHRLYKGGLRMSPGNDYSIAGTGITFSGASIPTSGTNLLIDYERLIF